jgi:hypothetical protein
VIDKDHELDGKAERASEALAKHRWHWTLDESNPKRVGFSDYARAIGVTDSVVRFYARAHALLTERSNARVRTIADALTLARQGVEQQAYTEAIAEGSGQTIAQVGVSSGRTKRKEIIERAEDRAERKGTDPVEEARTIAATEAKAAKAKKKRKQEEKQRHSVRFIHVEGHLAGAQRKLMDALKEAQGVGFSDEEMELIRSSIDNIHSVLNLIDLRMAGAPDVDWDGELAKLTGSR